jgi:hypothetical protein
MSDFPQATRLYFSIAWCAVPLQVLFLLLLPGFVDPEKMIDSLLRTKRVSSRVMAQVTLLFVFLSMLFVAVFLMGGDEADTVGWMPHEIAYRLMSSSRLWMGILGSAFLLGVAFSFAVVLISMRHLIASRRGGR